MAKTTISICLTAALIACCSVSYSSAQGSVIYAYIGQKCGGANMQQTGYEAQQAFDTFSKKFNQAIETLPANLLQFCDRGNRTVLIRSFNRIVDTMADCWPQQEKFLGKFASKSFEEFLHFLCHSDGTHVKKLYAYGVQQCLDKLRASDHSQRLDECLRGIGPLASGNSTSKLVTKEGLCKDLTTAKNCIRKQIHCTSQVNAESLEHLTDHFFQYIMKPCGACAVTSSAVLLAVMLLISLRKELFSFL